MKSGHLRVHFQHSGAKIRVFVQKTDSIKFWHFLGVISKEKKAVSAREIDGKFRRPRGLTENPDENMLIRVCNCNRVHRKSFLQLAIWASRS